MSKDFFLQIFIKLNQLQSRSNIYQRSWRASSSFLCITHLHHRSPTRPPYFPSFQTTSLRCTIDFTLLTRSVPAHKHIPEVIKHSRDHKTRAYYSYNQEQSQLSRRPERRVHLFQPLHHEHTLQILQFVLCRMLLLIQWARTCSLRITLQDSSTNHQATTAVFETLFGTLRGYEQLKAASGHWLEFPSLWEQVCFGFLKWSMDLSVFNTDSNLSLDCQVEFIWRELN